MLLVKLPRLNTRWAVSAVAVRWKMYEVEIAADGAKIAATAPNK